ncbi:MAG: hypothetical protein SP4CHLAM5_09520 [Chlamydiia bacterium]|nr:hypothetical protein [Chlamydiia bacterium]MCH9618810.1 hypothetical protein [Chlamydiia bacterium]
MWERQAKKRYSGISPTEVWGVWKDVSAWPDWNTDMEFCKINGPFEKGTTIDLKPRVLPSVKLQLEEVLKERLFIDSLPLPGAKMLYKHEVLEIENGIELITIISITGESSDMWIPLIGEKIAANMITQMDAVAEIILKRQSKFSCLRSRSLSTPYGRV